MWQKAKVIETSLLHNRGSTGKECWVKGPPLTPDGEIHDDVTGTMSWTVDTPHFETNIRVEDDGLLVDARAVELLSEFADDVPIVRWEDFIK